MNRPGGQRQEGTGCGCEPSPEARVFLTSCRLGPQVLGCALTFRVPELLPQKASARLISSPLCLGLRFHCAVSEYFSPLRPNDTWPFADPKALGVQESPLRPWSGGRRCVRRRREGPGVLGSRERKEDGEVTEAASTRQRSRPRPGHSGVPSRGRQLRVSSAHTEETGEACLVRAV